MSDNATLKGRVAVVTGASRGIGRAIAQRLAAAGATVVIAARSVDHSSNELAGTLAETAALIAAQGGKAIQIACDVENAQSREKLIADVVAQAGRIDILINNAGRAIHAKLDDTPPEDASSQTEQYLLAPYDLARLAVPHMRRQGGGWIVNLGSSSAATPSGPPYPKYATSGGAALYAALKAAVHRLSVSLAAELLADNISVNILAPVGGILTPGVIALGVIPPGHEDIAERVEHIAEAALALVESEPRSLTGVTAASFEYLDKIGRSTRSLDGVTVVQARG